MKKNKSNPSWVHAHINDPYVKMAQKDGYRARAAYKLKEIDDEYHLIKSGMVVVDLGSTPGSWSQVVREKLAHQGQMNGRIIALDLLEMEPIAGVDFILGDFREDEVLTQLQNLVGDARVDLVLSDMAPNLSGIASVDAARIAAEEHPSNTDSRIRFHSGVWMEQLPFQDASFDCVCSQFGIEYAAQAQAWGEVFRVLVERGKVACVIHHRASAFYAVAQSESRHLQWLLAADGVLAAACEVAGWLELMRSGQQVAGAALVQANASRSRFNSVQEILESRIREGATPDVLIEVRAQIASILANAPKPRETMMAYRQMLDQSFVRCRELVECALDRQQVDELASSLRSCRRETDIRIEELSQEQGVLAWGFKVAT